MSAGSPCRQAYPAAKSIAQVFPEKWRKSVIPRFANPSFSSGSNQVLTTHTGLIPKRFAGTAELPNIWGIKDSTGDLDLFLKLRDLLDDRPDFTILIRPEQLRPRFPVGAHGVFVVGQISLPGTLCEPV